MTEAVEIEGNILISELGSALLAISLCEFMDYLCHYLYLYYLLEEGQFVVESKKARTILLSQLYLFYLLDAFGNY